MQLNHFVHVLLFACSKCGEPVVSTRLDKERNQETVDAVKCMLTCRCGWREERLGASASKHWVEQWGERELTHIQS
jgi:transcription elongation factor Elf1